MGLPRSLCALAVVASLITAVRGQCGATAGVYYSVLTDGSDRFRAGCSACENGYYCPGDSRRYPCAAGTHCISNAGSLATLPPCFRGYYCPAGATIACPAGTYNPNTGSTSAAACLPCTTAGRFCDEASTVNTNTCPAGYYCPTTATQTPCPVGTYNPNPSATSAAACIACTAGNACDTVGRTTGSTQCLPGAYCPAAVLPLLCPAGRYNPNYGGTSASACTSCPSGNYCATPGTWMLTTCPTGWYCPAGVPSVPCPAGTYNPSTGRSAASACLPCPAGSVCATPGASDVTVTCPAGWYCPAGFSSLRCPAGTYNPNTGSTSSAACLPCPAGIRCDAAAQSNTQPCDPAYFCPAAAAPALCPAGTYCPFSNMSAPLVCPAGSYCAGAMAIAPCPAGSFCPAGSISPGVPCPPGWFCPAAAAPAPCPAGRFCPSANMTAPGPLCPAGTFCLPGSSSPIACPADSVCPAGAANGTVSSNPVDGCPAGYYCMPGAGGSPIVLPCGFGFSCPPGSSSPSRCPLNTISGPSSATCTPCSVGTYAPSQASSACLPCGVATAASTCRLPSITWRDSLTVVNDSIGAQVNLSIAFISGAASVPCSSVSTVTTSAVSCTLALFPAVASNVSTIFGIFVSYNLSGVWTGWQSVGMNVTITPPPSVSALGGAAPLAAGSRMLLQLPRSRPSFSDWTTSGIAAPSAAVLNATLVTLNGAACTSVTYLSDTLLTCAAPLLDGPVVTAAVQVAGNLTLNGSLTLFTPPSLRLTPSTPLRVLLPPASSSMSVNITIAGTALCSASAAPRLSAVAVAGVPCSSLVCISPDALTCIVTNTSMLVAAVVLQAQNASRVVAVSLTAMWTTVPITCSQCISAVLAPVVYAVYPASVAGAGVTLVITADDVGSAESPVVAVFIGGVPCLNTVVSTITPGVVTCTTPSVSTSVLGFPTLPVTLMNAVGATSAASATVSYPASFSVSWVAATMASAPMTIPAVSGSVTTLTAPLSFTVSTRDAATCSLTANVSTLLCPPSAIVNRRASVTLQAVTAMIAAAASNASVFLTASDSSSTITLVIPSSGTTSFAVNIVTISAAQIAGPSGCFAPIAFTCVDALGRTAATDSISVSIAFSSWDAAWSGAISSDSVNVVATPSTLPPLRSTLSVTAVTSPAAAVNVSSAWSLFSCLLVVGPSGTFVSSDTALSATALYTLAAATASSTLNASASSSSSASITLQWQQVDFSWASLGLSYTLLVECMWAGTGERIRLPRRSVVVPNVTLTASPASATVACGAQSPESIAVEAYSTTTFVACAQLLQPLNMSSSVVAGLLDFSSAESACSWSVPSQGGSALSLSTSTTTNGLQIRANGTTAASLVVLQGPPNIAGQLLFTCFLWRQRVTAPATSIILNPFRVAFAGTVPPSQQVLPSSAGSASSCPSPAVCASALIISTAATSVTCLLTVSTFACPANASAAGTYGLGSMLTSFPPSLTGSTSVTNTTTPNSVNQASLAVGGVQLVAASGCTVRISAVCTDSLQRSNTSMNSIVLTTPRFIATWDAATLALVNGSVVAPVKLPSMTAAIGLDVNASTQTDSVSTLASGFMCMAYVSKSSAVVPVSNALSTLPASATLSSSIGTLAPLSSNTTSPNMFSMVGVSFTGLDATGVAVGTPLVMQAECVWTATGERVRLAPLYSSTVNVTLQAIESSGNRALRRVSAPIAADVRISFQLAMAGGRAASSLLPQDVSCSWITLRSTTRQLQLQPAVDVDLFNVSSSSSSSSGDAAATLISTVQLTGAAAQSLLAVYECSMWGSTVTVRSNVVNFTSNALRMVALSLPARVYTPSDSAAPLLLSPLLRVSVVTFSEAAPTVVTDVSCSLLSSDVLAAAVVPSSNPRRTAGDYQNVRADADGVIAFPPFGVNSAFSIAAAPLYVECRRDTGDAPDRLNLLLQPVALAMTLCNLPSRSGQSGTSSNRFSVGLQLATRDGLAPMTALATADVTAGMAAVNTTSCLQPAASGIVVSTSLNSVSCALSVQTAFSPDTTTASAFLQGAVQVMNGSTLLATYGDFRVSAPPATSYALTLACSMSSISLPGTFTFTYNVQGCAAGTQVTNVLCTKCATSDFSMGTQLVITAANSSTNMTALAPRVGAAWVSTCTQCPPVGATCIDGVITLLPNFYRPPSQVKLAIGPSMELHPCFNGEACVVDTATLAYNCAAGYTGPLCGVCDYDNGYAPYGQACRPCGDVRLQFVVLSVLIAIALAALAYLALKPQSGVRTDTSIALKIALGYVQAIGSLKAFQSGGTRAYRELFSWTDTVSANPLSVGALQCVWRPSFLLQFVMTISLPVLASLVAVLIMLTATLLRSVRCTSCQRAPAAIVTNQQHGWFDGGRVRLELSQWLRQRRHVNMFVLVLFITYMSIISSSLRALDCYSPPVDGITYLRMDLRVKCHEGEHLIASIIAYCMLVIVGLGFPLGVFLLLQRADEFTLQDTYFRAAWGFLFDGYRSRTTHADAADAIHVKGEPEATTARMAPDLQQRRRSRVHTLFTLQDPGSDHVTLPTTTGSAIEVLNPLQRQRKVTAPSAPRTVACLVAPSHVLWWEGVILIRKACIVLLAVLMQNAYAQSALATIALGVALTLQLYLKPYTRPLFNVLECLSLGSAAFTAVLSGMLLQYDVADPSFSTQSSSNMTVTQWSITVVLGIVNLATLAVLGGAWALFQLHDVSQAVDSAKDTLRRSRSTAMPRSGTIDERQRSIIRAVAARQQRKSTHGRASHAVHLEFLVDDDNANDGGSGAMKVQRVTEAVDGVAAQKPLEDDECVAAKHALSARHQPRVAYGPRRDDNGGES